jgi:hypothetical protein
MQRSPFEDFGLDENGGAALGSPHDRGTMLTSSSAKRSSAKGHLVVAADHVEEALNIRSELASDVRQEIPTWPLPELLHRPCP